MKKLIFLLFIFISTISYAQNSVSGVVCLKKDQSPIVGVIVNEFGTENYTSTNSEGEFTIDVSGSNAKLQFSGLGLVSLQIQASGRKDLGKIYLDSDVYTINDAIVSSSFVVDRLTPISASTVTGSQIEKRLGSREFVEILKNTPGVHPNRQGGGWGDSEIFMRGFDNSNIAILVNGVQINDMEAGAVYWSDWANLSEVAATIQTQRGIGTSKLSSPSVGGTINIITKGVHALPGGNASVSLGSHGYNKISFAVNSGLMKNGWAMSLLGSRTAGDGYFQGGDFEMFSYFLNFTKVFNDSHQIIFTGFGAPQKHFSRSNALTASEWERIQNLYNLRDWREYNPDYGFDSNGQRKTNDYSEYHKPFVSLSHNWNINQSSKLNTSVYMAFGRGGSYSGKADEINYSEYDWYATDYGYLNTKFRCEDGTYDYAKIESINASSDYGAQLVMTQIDGRLNTYGITSIFSHETSKGFDFYGGIDVKYYYCSHTNRIIDLFGGDYYIDPCRKEVLFENNTYATEEWMTTPVGIGDVAYRDYDSYVMQEGIFSQLEYSNKQYSAFLSASLSNTTYWKIDHFYHSPENSRSDNANYLGGTIKGGFNYNINEYHNVFLNSGFISRAPQFKSGAFMSATSSNVINEMAVNEKSATFEVGYGFHNDFISAGINGYYTRWMDKSMTKKGKITEQYYINMSGVDSRHMGLEIEFKARPARWVEVGAMVSLGDWQWDSDNVKGYAYSLSGQAVTSDGKITSPGSEDHAWAIINMKGVKVGGSAQTTASIDANFYPFKGFHIGTGYTFFDRNYAYYSLSGSSLKLGKELFVNDPWRIPSYGCLDINASYQIDVAKQKIALFFNLNNVLDTTYIEKAWNPSNVTTTKTPVNPDEVYMFYALGRNWSIGVKYNF